MAAYVIEACRFSRFVCKLSCQVIHTIIIHRLHTTLY